MNIVRSIPRKRGHRDSVRDGKVADSQGGEEGGSHSAAFPESASGSAARISMTHERIRKEATAVGPKNCLLSRFATTKQLRNRLGQLSRMDILPQPAVRGSFQR